MRRIQEAVLPLAASDEHLPKTVREYHEKYKGVSRILDEHPEILELVHEDFKKLSQGGRKGRSGDFTSETLLRALIVHAIEGLSFRETVVRIAESPSKKRQRKVKGAFRALIGRVGWIVEVAATFCELASCCGEIEVRAVGDELKRFLPSMKKVVTQARRAQLEGETVPAGERVFSIFEPHTELIKRGRREKPVEFGHAVLLCQTPEKFITDYEVFAERPADCALTEQVIERHEKLFGERPEVLAADKGFCPAAEAYAELEERVGTLAIPRRMRDFADKVLSMWQAFRAGIEGTISGLKRAFRLARCFYRGFKHFQGAIGLGVLAHNLVVLAKQGIT
jgi:IS5 family transposase